MFTTLELYHPIAVLQQEHEIAMKNLCVAVAKADTAEIKRLFELIVHVERSQREAAQLIRTPPPTPPQIQHANLERGENGGERALGMRQA